MKILQLIAPFVMPLLYYLIVSPLSFFLRLIGKSLIPLELDKSQDSYWITKDRRGSPREYYNHP
mgnify:CR=1 FL=1